MYDIKHYTTSDEIYKFPFRLNSKSPFQRGSCWHLKVISNLIDFPNLLYIQLLQ